jgi:hypothetical protein
MILARLSRHRRGTFFLAFLVILVIIILVMVLIHAFRPHYSPPPPTDPSLTSDGNDATAGDISATTAAHLRQHPPPCGSLIGPVGPGGHNYISFTCGDIANPNNPPSKGPVPAKGWTAQGGATLQRYNTNFGDNNKSRLQGYKVWNGTPHGVSPDRSNGNFMIVDAAWNVFFFSGGPDNAQSSLSQTENFWKYRCLIDKGNLPYHFYASIGATTLQGDTGQVTLTFLDQNLNPLSSVTVGPVAASALGGVPKLVLRQKNGTVPVGTRFAQIQMIFARAGGSNNTYNDGAIAEPTLNLGS